VRFLALIAAACSVLVCAHSAVAQGVSMLNPMRPLYELQAFVFDPPDGDGWRELGAGPDTVRIVYAEQLAEGQINTRADFTAQTFEISTAQSRE
jgi:hypothetical protein